MNSHLLSQWLSESSPSMPLHRDSDQRKAEVLLALRLLGANEFDLFLPESRCLPRVLENLSCDFVTVMKSGAPVLTRHFDDEECHDGRKYEQGVGCGENTISFADVTDK